MQAVQIMRYSFTGICMYSFDDAENIEMFS